MAPWFPPGEAVGGLHDRHLFAAHGRHDHVTSFRATLDYVERARSVAASAELRDMGLVGHYMLRRVTEWNETATSSALRMLQLPQK